ncbi:ribonuclease H-like domain-containing protein [Tanacetum coccineum]
MDFKEKLPVSLDKSKIECYNYHRKRHFAKEYRPGRNQGKRSYGDNSRSNAPTNESSSQALVAQDGLGGYDWSNDFEIEPNYDSEREKHSRARLEIQGYELALESLESRILVHEKNELAWGEKYDQMSARDKIGLGYGTQLNEMSNNSETDSEISLSVFDVRSSDEESTPANDRFSKANGFHAVPPPITGNFLTPRADILFAGKTNEANTQKSKIVYESVNRDKVIIEDWNSDDEDDVSEVQTVSPVKTNETQTGNLEILLQDHAMVDSGCSSHMTSNKAYIFDYEDYNGGFVAFGSDPKGGKIMGKGKFRTANLDFDDVYFVDELKFNFFSVSQMCDKKNSVLFTETECLILSPSFKLFDESQVVLRAPRKDDVYSLDLKIIIPSGGITCLYANATADESKLWHRRLGHVNFKNINKLVKGYLVRGLPSKVFMNDHTCVACKKGKQHKDSLVAKLWMMPQDKLFEREKRGLLHLQKRAAQTTSINILSLVGHMFSTATCAIGLVAAVHRQHVKCGESSIYNSDAFSSDGIFNGAYDHENVGAVADFNNMDDTIIFSPIPTLRIHKNHPKAQILGDPKPGIMFAVCAIDKSWQCKKQTFVANFTMSAEYVAVAHCCGIRRLTSGPSISDSIHFIRDCYEKRLIEVIKIHTDSNVADLLTKGFDVTRFNFFGG